MENDIINLLLNHGTFSERISKPILYHTVKMAHSIQVGQKFEDYQAFAGVEINFFSYLQKIASAMISNLLNASCYSQNEKYDFLLYYCQYH